MLKSLNLDSALDTGPDDCRAFCPPLHLTQITHRFLDGADGLKVQHSLHLVGIDVAGPVVVCRGPGLWEDQDPSRVFDGDGIATS